MPPLYNITLNSKILSQLKLDVNDSFIAETTEEGYFYEYSKKKSMAIMMLWKFS